MSAPGIVVAIPALNGERTIASVLDQLRRELPTDRTVLFAVLDGGSQDRTRAIVAELAGADPRIQLVENRRRIQSAAINLAASMGEGKADILVRCDAHSEYPPGFIRDVAAALDRTGADSVVVPMDSVGTSCVGRAIAWVSDTPAGSGGSAHRGGKWSGEVDHGHHAGWRLLSFLAVGGYDEGFTHNEDAELDCRLRRTGMRIWLDADLRIIYFVRPTLSALARQYRNYGRGRSRTVRRHPGSMRARQLAVPAFVGANLLALLLSPVLSSMLLLPLLYLLGLSGVSALVAIKHKSPCGVFAGPAALVMHVAWAFGFAEGWLTIRQRPWRPATEG